MNEGSHRERFVVASSHARLVSIPTIERRGAHPRVAVGIRDLRFHQEVLDWIERDARIDVIGAASDPESFVRLRAQHAVDVCVACPQIAHELRHPSTRQDTSTLLLVAQEMTVPLLRDAIDLGSQGVFSWPEERVELTNTIVEAAAPIFNQRGYEGSSLNDLMEATGLKKGGIYRHFASKEELAVEAFDYTWEAAWKARLLHVDEKANGIEKLKQLIANFVDRRSPVAGGCPILNTVSTQMTENPVLRERSGGSELLKSLGISIAT